MRDEGEDRARVEMNSTYRQVAGICVLAIASSTSTVSRLLGVSWASRTASIDRVDAASGRATVMRLVVGPSAGAALY